MSRHRQPASTGDEDLVSGTVRLSPQSHTLWCAGEQVDLTLREFDVLLALMRNEGKVLSRERIIAIAWGASTAIVVRVIDVHVSHLRAKLGKEGRRIETVPQVGFKWSASKR
jgi:DNA-binding response OmpR family regulator